MGILIGDLPIWLAVDMERERLRIILFYVHSTLSMFSSKQGSLHTITTYPCHSISPVAYSRRQ